MEDLQDIYWLAEYAGAAAATGFLSVVAYERMKDRYSSIKESFALERFKAEREELGSSEFFDTLSDQGLKLYLEDNQPSYDISERGFPETSKDAEEAQQFIIENPVQAARTMEYLEEARERGLMEDLT